METSSPSALKLSDIVFVNPVAGGGHAADCLPSLQALALRSSWNVDFRITTSAKDLVAQAQQAASEGFPRFLVLGGDGTFQDLVNALTGFPDAILGILPAGGGNDLADALGLPHDPVSAAQLLLKGKVCRMDVVRTTLPDGTQKLYTGGGGVGVDARTAYFASTTFRKLNGRLRYMLAAARALIGYKPVHVRVQIHFGDDAPTTLEASSLLLAVLNTPSYGAGLRFAPDASITDGRVDLVLVREMPFLELLTVLPRLALKGEVRSRRVSHFSVQCLTIETSVPSQFHGDGEILGETPLKIEVVPQAVRILCPPRSRLSPEKPTDTQ